MSESSQGVSTARALECIAPRDKTRLAHVLQLAALKNLETYRQWQAVKYSFAKPPNAAFLKACEKG